MELEITAEPFAATTAGPPVSQSRTTKKSLAPPKGASESPPEQAAIESAVRTILAAVGEDVNRPDLKDTPARVARMYSEMFAGLHLDPARHLEVTFPEDYDELVLVCDITFTSMCEHHLLPFRGARGLFAPGESHRVEQDRPCGGGSGPPAPQLLETWRARFERMHLLRDFCGSQFEQVRNDFLNCLDREGHYCHPTVRCCIANHTKV